MNTESVLIDQWRSLLSEYSRVAQELDRALQHHHGMTMSDYEVLDRLVDAGCKARAQELVGDLHLSQSALSRAVARMEKCGLVERAMCDTDRRGVFVTATDAGRAAHSAARATQLDVLKRHLADRVPQG
ncbi:MarR family winged helix-turn-helix transcriptional regulator [Streptodolium elevatio]|uniref:MarR family transcriptional regulator n=1 Tax=Streptodolium elevatio TaxID=3157996 RepID=A0ABV3DSP2_9ACTN